MRGRHSVILALFVLAVMLATAMLVAAAPRVVIIEVKGMVCAA